MLNDETKQAIEFALKDFNDNINKTDTMTEHIFFESPERSGAFIMQFAPPFCWGQIYKFKTGEELKVFLRTRTESEFAAGCQLTDYHIVILHRGSLVDVDKEKFKLQTIYREMGDYFFEHKIKKHEGYYKKYKAK